VWAAAPRPVNLDGAAVFRLSRLRAGTIMTNPLLDERTSIGQESAHGG